MKIFAYGSNMNIERLRERVPSASKLTNAFITGYSLACNKVSKDGSAKANIKETGNPNDIVWGVIFEIDSKEKGRLDRAEGLGNGYDENTLIFTDQENNNHAAQVYIANDNAVDHLKLPYDWYKLYITSGATQNELPLDYLKKLNSLPCIVDPDEERRKKNLQTSGI